MKYIIHMIKQFGKFIKRNHVILLAFLLPSLILEIAYMTNFVFPFGSRGILIIDLYHQYAPFISDLQDKLRHGSSLLYSWSGGLGISYLPLFAYYVASPLNLITLIFPKDYLTEAVLVLTLLKAGLSGACFAFYLKGVHREKNLITVAFSMLYALSGYVLVFCWNIMWMDAIYLLPLIMLGLVKLVRDGKGMLFCIALAVALLSNFYMGFFICAFVLLYFPVCLIKHHNFGKPSLLIKRIGQFAGFSLLAAGLSAILLIPTFFQLRITSAANDMFPKTLINYFDLFDYMTRNFTAASPSIREGMPNIYAGIVVLILLPVYFLCKGIRLKEKLWNLALLLVLILSFNLNIMNFIWHGFHYPNQVPYRYSFVFIFLVLTMCYEGFKGLYEFSGKQIGTICLIVLCMVLVSQKFDGLNVGFVTVYASALFVILYGIPLYVGRNLNVRPNMKALALVLVVAAELTTNSIATTYTINNTEYYQNRDGYSSGKEVAEIRDQISGISAKDKSFYRMEILPPETTNDPALYNYRGFSIFSSTATFKPVKFFGNLGFSSNGINSYMYTGSTAVMDSLFGIKYLIYRDMNTEEKLYKQAASTDELKVFENPYALPLGFQALSDLKGFSSSNGSNPFDAQNSLMQDICGVNDILSPIGGLKLGNQNSIEFGSQDTNYYSFTRSDKEKSSTARIKLSIDKAGEVYLYYRAPSNMKGSGLVSLNGKDVKFNAVNSTIINLGYCEDGTSAELQLTFDKGSVDKGSFGLYAYGLNEPEFERSISLIKEKSMTIESFTDTDIRGSIECAEDGMMVLSIPYDKGWHVKVDGHSVNTQAVDDALLSFELPKGSHKIELTYFPENLSAGIMITVISVFVLIFLFVVKKGIIVSAIKRLKKGDK